MTETEHPSGWNWRFKDGVQQIRTKIEIGAPRSDVNEFIEQIRTAAASVDDPTVDVDREYGSYGEGDHDHLVIEGWRAATEEDIEAYRFEARKTAERKAESEQRQIAALRKSNPDLFR